MEYFKNGKNLVIEEKKVKKYLLNPAHPDGGGKAKYFENLGYTHSNWKQFVAALGDHAVKAEITQILSTEYGMKFILEGVIETLEGSQVLIRSVWVVNKQEKFPILVIAYPLKDDKRI
jgi:hypothetical protein